MDIMGTLKKMLDITCKMTILDSGVNYFGIGCDMFKKILSKGGEDVVIKVAQFATN